MSSSSIVAVARRLLVASLISSPLAAPGLDRPVAEVDRDAQLIFRLTLGDAKLLQLDGQTSSETITIGGTAGAPEYRFRAHTLSCGTHMTGTIRETKEGGKTRHRADFDVSDNPYGIEKLLVDLVSDDATAVVSGAFTVNGRRVDAALLK